MAKKKSKKNELLNLLGILAFITAAVAGVLLLFNVFKLDVDSKDEILVNGLKLAFGGDIKVGDTIIIKLGAIKSNILFLVAFILPIAAGLIQVILKNKMSSVLSIILLILGVVILLSVKQVTFAPIIGKEFEADIALVLLGYVSIVLSFVSIVLISIKLIKE